MLNISQFRTKSDNSLCLSLGLKKFKFNLKLLAESHIKK